MIDHDAIAARVRQNREAGTPGPWALSASGYNVMRGKTAATVAVAQPSDFSLSDARRISALPDLEAAYLALYDEVKRLRANLHHVLAERDATFALMLARAEAAEAERVAEWNRRRKAEASRDLEKAVCATIKAERDALLAAGDRLSVCAQTTGGTAGRDDGLVAAITGWKEARQALKGQTND